MTYAVAWALKANYLSIYLLTKNDSYHSGTSSGEASSSIEQEKYFKLLVAATPISNRNTYSTQGSDSLTSLDSLMMVGLGDTLRIPDTPEQLRRSMAHSGGGGPSGASSRSSVAAHPKPTCKFFGFSLLSGFLSVSVLFLFCFLFCFLLIM